MTPAPSSSPARSWPPAPTPAFASAGRCSGSTTSPSRPTKLQTATLVGPFEREAIRPHVFGRFEDMLVASSSHPAHAALPRPGAVGRAGQRWRRWACRRGGKHGGLNENLAREIMELHTLGVGSGYSQADVTEFARAMTGWSIVGLRGSGDRRRRQVHLPPRRARAGRAHDPGQGLSRRTGRAGARGAARPGRQPAHRPPHRGQARPALRRRRSAADPGGQAASAASARTGGQLGEVADDAGRRAGGLVARGSASSRRPTSS